MVFREFEALKLAEAPKIIILGENRHTSIAPNLSEWNREQKSPKNLHFWNIL